MAVILPATGSGDATPSVATYTTSAGASGTHVQRIQSRPDVSVSVLTISTTNISAASTADTAIVTGVASQTIRILGVMIGSTAAQTWKFKSSTATDLMPFFPTAAGGTFVLPITGQPWFVTTTGDTLYIIQSTGLQISGKLWYTQSS